MSKNADALPGRTKDLVELTRKTFGDAIDLHGDANSSYDPPQAIEVGRMLEEYKFLHYEEPCQFDDLEATKKVADALTIPVAGRRTGVQRAPLPLDDLQPWCRHRAARSVLLRRDDPILTGGAYGGARQDAHDRPPLGWIWFYLQPPFRLDCA